MTKLSAIESVRIEENVEENDNNDQEIMENINKEEDEDTRIMRLRFEKILHTLTASEKKNIAERAADKLKKGVAIVEIGRVSKLLEKRLGNTNNICSAVDAMGRKIKEEKD